MVGVKSQQPEGYIMARKWFRVGVEGQTADGRKIERRHIAEVAETYNRDKYGARLFVEHIRGINPEWGFRAMGDVYGLRTETVKIDGEDRLALYAEIEPTEQMIAWARDKQKIYTSMEIDPDFAGSGKAYLVGLGVTDSPASLATEVLEFCAANPGANFLAPRKLRPENMFTAAQEVDARFDAQDAGGGEATLTLRQLLASMFGREQAPAAPAPPKAPATVPGGDALQQFAAQTLQAVEGLQKQLQQQRTDYARDIAQLRADYDRRLQEFRGMLDNTTAPNQTRPPATGGTDRPRTDC